MFKCKLCGYESEEAIEEIDNAQKDFANLDIIDKEIALKIIDEAFEDVIEK